MQPRTAVAIWGRETIDEFRALKKRLDPKAQLQTNLARRIFPEWFAA